MNAHRDSEWAVGLTQQIENNTGQHCSRFVLSIPLDPLDVRVPLLQDHPLYCRVLSPSRLPHFPPRPFLYPSSSSIRTSQPFFTAPPRTAYVFLFISRGLKRETEKKTVVTDCYVYSERRGDGRLHYLSRSLIIAIPTRTDYWRDENLHRYI